MKAFLTTHIMVSVHLIFMALALIVSAVYVHYSERALVSELDSAVRVDLEHVHALAEIMGWNGADAVVAAIITDCTARDDFDRLIGKLDSLERSELIRAQQLMEGCGSFYPTQNALMSARLREAFSELEESVAHRARITDRPLPDVDIEPLRRLVILEEERSTYLREQYELQRDIISELIRSSSSTSIRELAGRAQDVAELLSVTNNELVNARTAALP